MSRDGGAGATAGPLGIVAGGGTLPVEIARTALGQGRPVHIVALRNQADAAIEQFPHTWADWGQIGAIRGAFRIHGCRDLVLAGTVRRPNLWSLRPDLGAWIAVPLLFRILKGGDDSILRRVIGFLEDRGFRIVGVGDVAPHLLATVGPSGHHVPRDGHVLAIARGRALLEALGPFDVGQAAVATEHAILAVEGAGGTDAMLRGLVDPRTGREPGPSSGQGVLVKCPKPGQELRLDLPAIGPRTIDLAERASLAGVAVQAGSALMLERDKLIARADAAGLFLMGFDAGPSPAPRTQPSDDAVSRPHMHSRRIPTPDERADIVLGDRLVATLTAHAAGGSAVIARRHVLAVQAAETPLEMVQRAGALHQWGRRGRRLGLLMLADGPGNRPWLLDDGKFAQLIEAAMAARLSGIAVVTPGLDPVVLTALAARANTAGLFLVTVEPVPVEPIPVEPVEVAPSTGDAGS